MISMTIYLFLLIYDDDYRNKNTITTNQDSITERGFCQNFRQWTPSQDSSTYEICISLIWFKALGSVKAVSVKTEQVLLITKTEW